MDNFDRSFNRTQKAFNVIFVFNMVVIVAVLIGAIILGYNVLTNPEAVGAFFGKIVKGFNNQ